ncbi:Prolamin-like domain [Arabidopsis thaliana x Arabidopsis arenosa]|uniref:Prolamin-like domain n=1 Tax=Arabidopsis thaliana x Arabidopsis arenosa TaxID=1240361 RepID=A0A8T1ZKR0_9BRAS|nr:Prolamin-like domain [Arabidopsis thaliana x Arabidopsis arenosa]
MQRMWATIVLALIVVLSISIQTKGNEKVNDSAGPPSSALAPQSENGLLPNPTSCLADVKTIPNCVKAVKRFKLKNVTKKCCVILLYLPEDCFGYLFPIRWIYRILLKIACKILGHI